MLNKNNHLIISKVLVVTFIFISILSISNFILKDRIQNAELNFYNDQLNTLVKDIKFNNNILESKRTIVESHYLNYLGNDNTSLLYIAKYDSTPTAAIFKTSTPDGYNGIINLLIAIRLKSNTSDGAQNTIANIKILQHQETPGLGDLVEPEKSNWLKSFFNQNIENIDIDSITGATITSEAVTKAINNTLLLVNTYPELYEIK